MNRNKKIEFGISEIQSGGGKCFVDGRCHRGPIAIGDLFDAVSEMSVPLTPQSAGPATLRFLASVKMKVESITAYGHAIQELSQTMTARIELSGNGFEHLRSGIVVSGTV